MPQPYLPSAEKVNTTMPGWASDLVRLVLFLCIWVVFFPTCMIVYHMHAWCLLMSEEGITFPELELWLWTIIWVLEVKSGSSVRTNTLKSSLQTYNLGLVHVIFHCLSLTCLLLGWPLAPMMAGIKSIFDTTYSHLWAQALLCMTHQSGSDVFQITCQGKPQWWVPFFIWHRHVSSSSTYGINY